MIRVALTGKEPNWATDIVPSMLVPEISPEMVTVRLLPPALTSNSKERVFPLRETFLIGVLILPLPDGSSSVIVPEYSEPSLVMVISPPLLPAGVSAVYSQTPSTLTDQFSVFPFPLADLFFTS